MKKIILLAFCSLLWGITSLFAQSKVQLPRTIVTTDGEIDDVDSFIRMLLYSNEYQLEGLIYSSSMWHYKGDGKGTLFTSEMEMTKKMYGPKTDLRWPGVRWIQDLVQAYEKVYPNLSLHAKNFPSPQHLNSIIKVGNIDFEGDMREATEGSDWIKNKLLDKNPAPIYLQAWGGANTIARALKSIEEQFSSYPDWVAIKEAISHKAIIYTIMDQDATYKNYIGKSWPKIRVFYNSFQFACLAYPWKRYIAPAVQPYFEGDFMAKNIILNHGALTKMYYSYGDGQKQPGDDEHIHGDPTRLTNAQWGSFKAYDFISEGDSPAFLQLIDVGLNNLEHPNYGGWGGRFVQSNENPYRYDDGPKIAELNPVTGKEDVYYPQTRWLQAIQEDFASRADWCVKSVKAANHPPKVRIKEGTAIMAKAGQQLSFQVAASDPDGHKVTLSAWPYPEAGSGTAETKLQTNNLSITIPATAKKGDTFHVVVEGKDNGSPTLSRYQRVVVTVN